jgi:acetylornithine/LysW-gamma-L-lysine aminotransferase
MTAVTINDQESPDARGTYLQMESEQDVTDTQFAVRNTATYESGVVPRRGETVMVAGEGCWMIDSKGQRYLDLTSSQGVAMLGYGHPVLTEAIQEQAGRMHACPNFFHNDTRAAFLEKLIGATPPHLTRAFIGNSGSEAIDGAIKFARLATGRTGIIAARNSFHGRTVGAVSLTWNPRYRRKFEPLLPDVGHIHFNDVDQLEAAVDDGTAAVVLEVIQGEGGVHEGSAEFLAEAQRICRERGALLVIDEVQTGFGRTGRWFGFQHFDLAPDIIALAKGLGGGFPMGAVVYTEEIQDSLFVGAHGSTFGGNPLACAAGVAALSVYQGGLIEQAKRAGDRLRAALEEAIGSRSVVREIRGKGLLIGIDLRTKAVPFLKTLMESHNVLALPAGSTVLRLLPPLIISDDEIELAVEAIASTLPSTA